MKAQLHKDLKGRAFTLQTNLEALADPKQALTNLVQKYGQDKIAYCAYIIHNQDIDENGNPVKPHMHGIFKFQSVDAKTTVSAVSKHTNIWENGINPVGKELNAIEYLTHDNEMDKHHYDHNEIVWLVGDEKTAKKGAGRPKNDKNRPSDKNVKYDMAQLLTDMFENGNSPSYYEVKTAYIEAFGKANYIANKKTLETQYAAISEDLPLQPRTTIWFYGSTCTGKSWYSDQISDEHDVFHAKAPHLFDKYRNESTIILEELRPDDISWSTLLTLTDDRPHVKTLDCRNIKSPCTRLKTVIINSPKAPWEYASECKSIERDEAGNPKYDGYDQLYRRIKECAHFYGFSTVDFGSMPTQCIPLVTLYLFNKETRRLEPQSPEAYWEHITNSVNMDVFNSLFEDPHASTWVRANGYSSIKELILDKTYKAPPKPPVARTIAEYQKPNGNYQTNDYTLAYPQQENTPQPDYTTIEIDKEDLPF